MASASESRSHTVLRTDGKPDTVRGTSVWLGGRARSEISNAMPLSEVVKPLEETRLKALTGLYIRAAILKLRRKIADGEALAGKGTDAAKPASRRLRLL